MRCDHEDQTHIGGGQIPVEMVADHDPYKEKFFMQSHVLLVENEDLLSLAAKAGCIGVFVGIESVSADTLSEANKDFNRVDCLKKAIPQ